jgi:xylan 1,4-beta-xylosidase
MMGLMGGDWIAVNSPAAASLDSILGSGVQGAPDIQAMAARRDRQVTVLAWNYHDDDLSGADASIELDIRSLPERVLARHYRIDQHTSNAYTTWKAMGSPQDPTPAQYSRLEAAGQLQLLESPAWRKTDAGRLRLQFPLPRHAVSLLELTW